MQCAIPRARRLTESLRSRRRPYIDGPASDEAYRLIRRAPQPMSSEGDHGLVARSPVQSLASPKADAPQKARCAGIG